MHHFKQLINIPYSSLSAKLRFNWLFVSSNSLSCSTSSRFIFSFQNLKKYEVLKTNKDKEDLSVLSEINCITFFTISSSISDCLLWELFKSSFNLFSKLFDDSLIFVASMLKLLKLSCNSSINLFRKKFSIITLRPSKYIY